MSSDDDLPAILVSAVDVATASEIITELISDGVEGSPMNGVEHGAEPEPEPEPAAGRGAVWRLQNKYYSARVRLLAAPDRAPPPAHPAHPARVYAHLIYLTEDECGDERACARRAEAAAARLERGAVRLLGAPRVAAAARLRAWAAAERYELVPLAGDGGDEGEDGEAAGVARLREALHAHVWPGLVRRAPALGPPCAADDNSSDDSSSSSWGSWRRAGEGSEAEGEGEAGAVERAEQFAAALALLPGARGAAGGGGGGGGGGGEDGARRLRAEQLLAAFCRALGHAPPPAHPPPPPPPPH